MSAAADSETDVIYVPPLDEGVPVVRPARAVALGRGMFRLLPTPCYDADDETWEFPPGSVVVCVTERRGGAEVRVARRLADLATGGRAAE